MTVHDNTPVSRLAVWLVVLPLAAFTFVKLSAAERPNVVVLLADDLGWKDIGCYDGPVKTPALDGLAANGVRFTDFYSGAAVCSPSRATLLTGRQHLRTGIYSWINDWEQSSYLLEREVTLAEVLQRHGYSTVHLGKWHLGLPTRDRKKPTPDKHGFDYWFATGNNAQPSHRNPANFVRHGEWIGKIEGYACQIVVDEAIRWLDKERNSDKPFFLNIWLHEPHAPIAAPEKIVSRYGEPDDPAAIYSGTIDNTDRAIARLLKKLDQVDAAENTLIIYSSDNGSYRADRVGHLRGAKGSNFEGGLRVPGIFCWPGTIAKGHVEHEPAGLVDLLPTVCGLLGIDKPEGIHLDGSDLSPLLLVAGHSVAGPESSRPSSVRRHFTRHQPLFWLLPASDPCIAIRDGNYSLVGHRNYEFPRDRLAMAALKKQIEATLRQNGTFAAEIRGSTFDKQMFEGFKDQEAEKLRGQYIRLNMFNESWIASIKSGSYARFQLFDLSKDPSQKTDLSKQLPDVASRLRQQILVLNADVMADAPDWSADSVGALASVSLGRTVGQRPLTDPTNMRNLTVTHMDLTINTLVRIGLMMAACWGEGSALQSAESDITASARWTQSYDAGYTDDQGAYAGGSEIMHLASHKGKLYAANGYWVDARWVIPPDAEKQSAQVLRLDNADGHWQVDLDLGKSNGLGLRYMKGNILKSVTFTRDESGKLLPQPQNLLVMAAGATFERGGAVSAWVRDDAKGTWSHALVRHGSSAGGVRWVPRDMEVYRDKVTGVERLFLLLGNPGVISGVFDPSAPTKIRWDKHLEFPFLTKGSFGMRPLGIAVANGSLFFSEGGSIYRRNDGERPTFTEILDLAEDTDTDIGGIRGLTTIANPNGDGQSLLSLWAPGARSTSQIKRLDPDGSGGYTLHNEASIIDLMRKALSVDITYTLGAHNMMYPVRHPVTGETVHIIGFQGNIRGKDERCWQGSQLYAGAMYAVRTADQTYSVHEVNNAYAPGKAVLVSPRTFCLSPFGDNQLYIGGHDSSNKISDDMAWIFKAPLHVALGVTPGLDAPPPRAPARPAARLVKGPVYELRIYRSNEGRFQHLIRRFREHTDRIFKKHGLEPVGYWIPTDAKAYRRTFVYILQHPSRYAAYKNWNSFSNDREWRAVLDKPEFQRLLAERPTSIFMTANDYSETSKNPIDKAGGVYELRTYTTNEGKLDALNDRFRDHTTRIFNRHGIKNIAYWTPFDKPASSNALVYLIHHASREQADANWKAFGSDPQWRKVARESQTDGKFLVKPPDRIYLKAMDFSPLK